MSDRIVLSNMVFQARHGVLEREKAEAQRFEVDLELELDLRPAGVGDDLAGTVDYRGVYDATRRVVESTGFDLLEALAETIAGELLSGNDLVDAVVVRVRKPEVQLGGPLDHAAVQIRRTRASGGDGANSPR
jgi:7,8-dihydroneopterin aldolase/epimerase/oxygenase